MSSLFKNFVFFCLAMPAVLTASTVFYVSHAGDDKNPGTQALPYKSIERAQEEVRQRTEKGLAQDLTVMIQGGIYRLNQTLVFGCLDGGTDRFSVTYRGSGDQPVILSGGEPVPAWQADGSGKWVSSHPMEKSVRELFVKGRRAKRARHPNAGYLRAVKAAEDRMSYFTFNTGEIPAGINARQTELVFIHDWSISRLLLENIDYQANRIYPQSQLGRQHPMMVIDGYEPHPRYYLENDPAFCDEAGEWYQRADGHLVYFPLPGELPAQIESIIPHLDLLLEIRGDEESGCMVENLHFSGLIFEHSRFNLPDSGYAGVQATFHMTDNRPGFDYGWRGVVPPAIRYELAINCTLKNIAIRHLGGAGLLFGRQTSGCEISASKIYDVSGNGLMIGESWSRQVGEKPWWQAAPDQAASGNIVENCLIEDCGVQYSGAVGIWVGFARYTQIRQNEIRALPYTGISVGWMWSPQPTPCMGNSVENNHIHHIMQVLSDGGGIYTLGFQPGTIVRGNLIHDVPLNAGRAESNGMFLDEGTTDIEITQNVIFNTARSPLRFHKARTNTVRENIFGLPADLPPVRYNSTDKKYIQLIDNKIILTGGNDDKILENAIKSWHEKTGLKK